MPNSPQPTDLTNIARRLREARISLDLTQQEVADAIGVTVKAWSSYETGWRTPPPSTMIRFKTRYGVSLDWVYAGDPAGLPLSMAETLSIARKTA